MQISDDPTDVVHSIFKMERTFNHPAARVFAKFAETGAKRAWFVDNDPPGWSTETYALDFKIGGREHGIWLSPEGNRISNETVYLDIVDDARIVLAYSMARDGVIMSASLGTTTFKPTDGGTLLSYCEQGAFLQNRDRIESREKGWAWLLDNLDETLSA